MPLRKAPFFLLLLVPALLAFYLGRLGGSDLIDWDEGVYALQAKWLACGFADGKPFNFQTPPLHQATIAVFFRLVAMRGWILPLVSILFSGMTILLLFRFARALYDREAALAAAVTFALSEYFLFFSKSGLSDAAFCCFFVGGLYFFYLGFARDSNRALIAAGLSGMLALYTKYSGILLVVIFFASGLWLFRKVVHRWIVMTVIAPTLAFLPYLAVFLAVVTVPGIASRHGTLLGFNHPEFIFYLVRFAPLPLFLAAGHLLHRIFARRGKTETPDRGAWLWLVLAVFFLVLGFYSPFFRLAYPLVALLSIFAGRLIAGLGKFRYPVLALTAVLSFFLGRQTIFYVSTIPSRIGRSVANASRTGGADYLIALVPPNVAFYIDGRVSVAENDAFQKVPGLFRRQTTIRRDANLLEGRDRVLFLYSSIFAASREYYEPLFRKAAAVDSFEFVDAPVYYRDRNNRLRTARQRYWLYEVRLARDDSLEREEIWAAVFRPEADFFRIGSRDRSCITIEKTAGLNRR